MFVGIACIVLFVVTACAGEVIGLVIEAHHRRRWRTASSRIGFGFDARRRRRPSLSRMLLPAVIAPGTEETIFSYGESLKGLSGEVEGFKVQITDFAVWDFFTRCPLVFRGVLCVIKGDRIHVPGQIGLVKWYSYLVDGFRASDIFRQFRFPHEKDFSGCYALFGRGGFAPWIFTPDLRQFCMDHRKEIDCVWVNEHEVVVLWVDSDPNRFHELVNLGLGIASRLAENVEGEKGLAPATT
jgi:hypothetical protein